MGNYLFGEIHVLVMLLSKGEGPFSLSEIREIADLIFNESGSYLYKDSLSSHAVSAIENYPKLFRKKEINGDIVFFRGERLPNLDYFFDGYPEQLTSYFSRLVDDYLRRKSGKLVYTRELGMFIGSEENKRVMHK